VAEVTMDGLPVLRTHEMPSNFPSPTSASQLIAHGCLCGIFDQAYLVLFGPGMEILVDNFTEASKGSVVLWAYLDASLAITQPKAFAKSDNILL
jgi:hypothetical protein